MNHSLNPDRGGAAFLAVLVLPTVILAALKLAGVIAWSWWWVLAPLWIIAGLALFMLAVSFWAAVDALSFLRGVEKRR